MILYHTLFICSECGAEMHLEDGAEICPYCGGALYRARSGRRKTVTVCRAAAKIFAGIAMPSLLAAIVLASPALFWFSVTMFTMAAAAALNGKEEAKKVRAERRL